MCECVFVCVSVGVCVGGCLWVCIREDVHDRESLKIILLAFRPHSSRTNNFLSTNDIFVVLILIFGRAFQG